MPWKLEDMNVETNMHIGEKEPTRSDAACL